MIAPRHYDPTYKVLGTMRRLPYSMRLNGLNGPIRNDSKGTFSKKFQGTSLPDRKVFPDEDHIGTPYIFIKEASAKVKNSNRN